MSTALKKEQLFTSEPVGRAVISLAVPTVIAQLSTVIYNMADTFFIGQLGDPDQVAAATLAMPVFMFLTAFSNLFGIGGAGMISRCLGAGERKKPGRLRPSASGGQRWSRCFTASVPYPPCATPVWPI